MEKTNKFIKQYQLEIKELFESDYHLVDSDEEFVRRLVGVVIANLKEINNG